MTERIENPRALFHSESVKDLEVKFRETYDAIRAYSQDYAFLMRIMTMDGYLAVIDNVLRGNMGYLRLVHEAIDNYVAQRDVAMLMNSLDKNMLTILEFAYDNCRSYQHYLDIINSVLLIRIYHEVLRYEENCKDELAKIVDFNNITSRIYKLKESQLSVANKLTAGKNGKDYENLYNNAPNNKDYLYEISKTSKHRPIRRMLDSYGDFIFSLFPCWLLSPENVSNLLPLKKNLFDLVIFDEASQVFIESTIPTIYRGKNIVVAGDAKQLRPSATFMKRYMGGDIDAIDDDSMAAALEVESLLDLAVARYDSSNLTYHYRSKYNELIAFSNSAFYSSKLNVAPNTSGNRNNRPIERYKVPGKWMDRTNPVEAKKVAELLAEIFKTRRNKH
jgi:superfamily I DNA and/or RNA helicase